MFKTTHKALLKQHSKYHTQIFAHAHKHTQACTPPPTFLSVNPKLSVHPSPVQCYMYVHVSMNINIPLATPTSTHPLALLPLPSHRR